MKNPWILPAAALVLGAAGGFFSGRSTSPAETAATATEATQRTRSASRGDVAAGAEDEAKRGARARNVAEAMNTPGHSARIRSLIDFYSGLSTDQLAEEAKNLENLPMSERIMASFLLFGRWAEVDPTAAMAQANTMGFAAGFVRPTILQSWASVDPENAAKYYAENPREFAMMGGPGGRGGSGSSMIASEWAKQDPQAALAWASSLSGGDKSSAMTSVIREIAMTDPKKAAEMAGSIDPGERGDAYESIARSYGSKSFGEAEIWVTSLPVDEQGRAMASAIEGLSQTDPNLALIKARAMTDGDDKNRALRDVLENLSKTDSPGALKQLATLTPEQQQRSIGPVIQNIAVTDNMAAREYVEDLTPGPIRDRGIQEMIQVDRKSNPSELVTLAETITDEGDRNRTVGMAAMRWMREDEAAAKKYIQTSTFIPDNMKQRLLDGGGRRGRFGR